MKQNTGKLEPLINEGPVGILKKVMYTFFLYKYFNDI